MQTEIERKFLTTSSLFKEQAVRVMDIHQGYIGTASKGEARVSIRDEKA
jgi:CYTH domain-containing protein